MHCVPYAMPIILNSRPIYTEYHRQHTLFMSCPVNNKNHTLCKKGDVLMKKNPEIMSSAIHVLPQMQFEQRN